MTTTPLAAATGPADHSFNRFRGPARRGISESVSGTARYKSGRPARMRDTGREAGAGSGDYEGLLLAAARAATFRNPRLRISADPQ
jgi:hypothetical protein